MQRDAAGPLNLHGTALAVGSRAILLRGASGSGKSDLALRTIALSPGPLVPAQPMLVADDRVVAVRRGNTVELSCPPALEGLIEARGVGIVSVPWVATGMLELIADLVDPSEVQRMPAERDTIEIVGVRIGRIRIAPFEASAPVKLMLALACRDG
jgi:serine kinase of HPr protein (carbohydrate metabolism regulator)